MKPSKKKYALSPARAGALAVWLFALGSGAQAADIDIYGPTGGGAGGANVMFFFDNSANWSNQSQSWTPQDSWSKCTSLSSAEREACKAAIEEVFYAGLPASEKRPWEAGFNNWSASASPTQGQVQLRALKFVIKKLICAPDAGAAPIKTNLGLSMFSSVKGSVNSNGHPVGVIHHAVQPLEGTLTSGTCKTVIDKLTSIDARINSSETKAPQDANYSAALYEVFKYFGGYSNPAQAANGNGAEPIARDAYGPGRWGAEATSLDDPAAFVDSARTVYRSPLSGGDYCGANYLVLVGNTYPKAESNTARPLVFNNLNYTPPALSQTTSDTARFADEWAYFLANTDVHDSPGTQRILTYAVNVYQASPDAGQTKLLKSMASVGGVSSGNAYIEVGGNLYALVKKFADLLIEVAARDSVFTATSLPVSTTTQGTYLNQIFIGKFRPDSQFGPRWLGNLKQYELKLLDDGSLDLVGQDGRTAVLEEFFNPLAKSFWTTDSVFFNEAPSGTPASISDSPDGALVDKGGAAQRLREANLQNASGRKLYTRPSTTGAYLSTAPFSSSNASVTSVLSSTEIAWVRGENNVPVGDTNNTPEAFTGSYRHANNTIQLLGNTGARHSIHGDVLHSRPVALNYGTAGVVVYYGTNDGMLHAVDGAKTGSSAGQELWSFIAPEHYAMAKRLRKGSPRLHLPENDGTGALLTPAEGTSPKEYGFDGPIGVFARYVDNGAALTEAIIYPAMRRGGRSVYAFDVTSKTAPRYLWQIEGGSGDFSKLGQTWSTPKPIVLPAASGAPNVVLIMGGGYDQAEDSNASSGIGNVVYIINGRTGARIKAIGTEFAVPSDITLVDVSRNGVPDRAYFADVRGNLYRINLPDAAADFMDGSKWPSEATKIASLGGKVFFAPDAVVNGEVVSLLVGTGDREKPLLLSSEDNFFMIKDGPARDKIIGLSDLGNVSANQPGNAYGCYLPLRTGEKVINTAFTIGGITYFGTNQPAAPGQNICSGDLGIARAYQFPLFCVNPTSTEIRGGGLLPSAVGGTVLIEKEGNERKVQFVIGSGVGGSPYKPEKPTPAIAPKRTRLYWRVDNKDKP